MWKIFPQIPQNSPARHTFFQGKITGLGDRIDEKNSFNILSRLYHGHHKPCTSSSRPHRTPYCSRSHKTEISPFSPDLVDLIFTQFGCREVKRMDGYEVAAECRQRRLYPSELEDRDCGRSSLVGDDIAIPYE